MHRLQAVFTPHSSLRAPRHIPNAPFFFRDGPNTPATPATCPGLPNAQYKITTYAAATATTITMESTLNHLIRSPVLSFVSR